MDLTIEKQKDKGLWAEGEITEFEILEVERFHTMTSSSL